MKNDEALVNSAFSPEDFSIRSYDSINFRTAEPEAYTSKNHHKVFFVRSGSGIVSIDGKTIGLEKGMVICLWEGQTLHIREANHVVGFALRFKPDFLPNLSLDDLIFFNQALFNKIAHVNTLNLNQDETRDFESLFKVLLNEYRSQENNYAKPQVLQYVLMSILSKLARKTRQAQMRFRSTSVKHDIYQRFQLLMEDNFVEHRDISFYSQHLGVNHKKLNLILKEFVGSTFKDAVLDRTIDESKRLLTTTGYNLKDVSSRLGFKNQAYFCFSFKRSTGMTPNQFRNSISTNAGLPRITSQEV